jgi:putative Mg2+ transporter-C (MgtC) family protein
MIAGHVLGGSDFDRARVAAQVVTSIGFLGAGVIWKSLEERLVHGLTTAASLRTTASVGLLVGVGAYLLVAVTAGLSFVIRQLRRAPGDGLDARPTPDPNGEGE